MGYALSDAGIRAAKELLYRTEEWENAAALLHARMEKARQRQKLLAADGAGGQEKEQLLQEMAAGERDILRIYRQLLKTEKEIEGLIGKLPEAIHRAVLELHFLHHLSFFDIAEKLHMDERHIYRVYKKALQAFSVAKCAAEEKQ